MLPLTWRPAATEGLLEVTVKLVKTGDNEGVNVIMWFGSNWASCWSSTYWETVTWQTACICAHWAIISHSPIPKAVTTPSLSTVAMLLSEVDQVMVLYVELSGEKVVNNAWCVSSVIKILLWLNNIVVGKTSVTITWQMAWIFWHLAIMSHSPVWTAVTTPLLTIATFSSVDDHSTILYVVLSGKIVADNSDCILVSNTNISLSNVMDIGRISDTTTWQTA